MQSKPDRRLEAAAWLGGFLFCAVLALILDNVLVTIAWTLVAPLGEELAKTRCYALYRFRLGPSAIICTAFVAMETCYKLWFLPDVVRRTGEPAFVIYANALTPGVLHYLLMLVAVACHERGMMNWRILWISIGLHYAFNVYRGSIRGELEGLLWLDAVPLGLLCLIVWRSLMVPMPIGMLRCRRHQRNTPTRPSVLLPKLGQPGLGVSHDQPGGIFAVHPTEVPDRANAPIGRKQT